MPKALNLYDARFEPKVARFKARHAVLAAACVAGLAGASAQAIEWSARHAEAERGRVDQALRTQTQLLAANAAAPLPAGTTMADIERETAWLQVQERAHRRTLQALEAGVAGVRQGPSALMTALGRHPQPRLWLTGFTVGDDGQDLELRGRMLNADALADYLRVLADEPSLRGRTFAALQIQPAGQPSGSGADTSATTDFALRSSGPRAEGAR